MSIDAMFREANAAQRAGDWADAERRYRELVRFQPLFANHNLGVVCVATGRFAEAEGFFRAALAIDPACAAPRHSLGALLLSDGRYAQGWPLWEARREIPGMVQGPRLSFPEWRGEELAGKHLLVVLEQGLGDQLLFARFIPELVARAAKVTFACDPSLTRLFSGLGCDLLPVTPGCAVPRADYWVMLMSLGLRLGVSLETLPSAPYLHAATLLGAGGGIGVVAQGSQTHINNRTRSLADADAQRLLALGRSLAPEVTGARDFQDTADIIAGLDLVISVDTSVANLAGAMGKPVWILIPAWETDWRWLQERIDSPWYPSARLYRQRTIGEWLPELRRIETDLREMGLSG